MSEKILLSFSGSATISKTAITALSRLFTKAGAQVIASDVGATVQKRAGVSFRSVLLTFADSQTVTLNVTESGDIFEVRINNSVFPMRNQDDQGEAVKEIAAAMNRKRAAFQRAATKAKTPVLRGVTTTRTQKLAAKRQRRDELQSQVNEAKQELEQLQAA